MENKKVIRSSQHRFIRGKSCFANLVAFYNETTACMGEGGAVDIAHLDLSKAFGIALISS